MKRPAKARPKTHAARKRGAPALIDATPVEPADDPDRPGIEAAEQVGPDDDPRRAQTNIERADEHRLGSVEGVADETRSDAIAGFIEPADDAPDR